MQITIDLPEPLAQQLADYLNGHPQETLVTLVQEALAVKALLQDSSVSHDTSKLLKLAEIVAGSATEHRSAPTSKEERMNRLFGVADRLVAFNEVAPLTEADIQAEIEAHRTEKR